MRKRIPRLPILAFILAFVASTSAIAMAGWIRIGASIPGSGFGGLGMACYRAAVTVNQVYDLYCSPPDTSTLPASSYTHGSAFWQNANQTQPTTACVTYWNQAGGECGPVTSNNNCPAGGGPCNYNFDTSKWQTHADHFKYVKFANGTSGANLGGYVFWY